MAPESLPALEGLPLVHRGKVRDVHRVDDDHLLLVATDRLSAFDVILPDPIPGKGIILTQLSLFWFERFRAAVRHHVVASEIEDMPEAVRRHADHLRGRALLVRELKIHPVECIVRGRLLGSGWNDYQARGAISGIALPPGLRKNAPLDPPIFTPSTKAEAGAHDENIDRAAMDRLLGADLARELATKSLEIFTEARRFARERGVLLCDTKFEWGVLDGATVLADEILTPDSSRYWKREEAEAALPDRDPPSYDKQVVRDWLETTDWDKTAPGPRVPAEVLELARGRYVEIYERLAGRPVPHLDP